jgi:hypothetical protein
LYPISQAKMEADTAAARFYDSIRWRLSARIDAEGWGGRVLARTHSHGPNQRQEPRAAIRLSDIAGSSFLVVAFSAFELDLPLLARG